MHCSSYALTCLSLAFGAMSSVTLALAVATDAWIFMSEPLTLSREILDMFNMTEQHHIMVHVRSGLWRVCTINLANGTIPDQCIPINYSQRGSGRLEGAPTSMTIVGAIRISAPLQVAALVLCGLAVLFSVAGSYQADVKTLVSGVFYILAGLCLSVGIILYISAINDEVGHRTSNSDDPFSFKYTYGWSFFVAGVGFLSSELAAITSITLFLRRHSDPRGMVQIIPGLNDKLFYDETHSIIRINNTENIFMLSQYK
ncbi:voltage-dependent calcium channel gamma-7 subunit-like [Gigantopelta aegis]|uniref:voltage-dependent calcium channel gamma-7 subunit-like n=1 Tax=Gigantopelta aegis TaxID=1735272 RepID=UPI001B88D4C9|nr:voltage-dependent calcium channel gamma-7 subunit-like [Gigantopelta aegis]